MLGGPRSHHGIDMTMLASLLRQVPGGPGQADPRNGGRKSLRAQQRHAMAPQAHYVCG